MASTAAPRRVMASPRERTASPAPARCWDGAHLHRRSSNWLAVPMLAVAVGAGALTALGPLKALVGLLVLLLAACVWRWPAVAAYCVIGLTPLTVGISRGSALPVVRPNEAIAILVGGTLAVRGVVRIRTGQLPKLRLDRVELVMVLMAVTNSLVPLLWMTVRQEAITHDDLLYALVLWKFLGLFGIPHLLEAFYAPAGGTAGSIGLHNGRGASTLGLPAATADLCIFNLAVVSGLWTRYRRHRPALAAAAALLVMGALSAGEFSSAIGLVVGLICMTIVLRKPRLLSVFIPATLVAGYALRPVIARRLSGFQSASGLPVSWTTRLQNLQTYFWPKLFSHGNFVLGVRPGARVAVPAQITGYVWIESGYTWLLWGGGIPLLAGFLFFVYAVARRGWSAARGGRDGRSVAGIAVFAAIFAITVLMAFDPHFTYRGSADDFFFLLALAAPRGRPPDDADAEHRTPELVMTEVGT